MRARTSGRGADLVLEATGTEAGVAAAFDGVRRRGRITAVGLSGTPSINVRWDFATTRDADLAFAMSSSYEAWEPALTILGLVTDQAASLPTYFPLADWAAALQAVADRTVVKRSSTRPDSRQVPKWSARARSRSGGTRPRRSGRRSRSH
ncbi:MAG: hypothetical protein LH650_05045 [Chloroflexi bacterium]|nr:hypothetical protein [Chloroflexota bacterium]